MGKLSIDYGVITLRANVDGDSTSDSQEHVATSCTPRSVQMPAIVSNTGYERPAATLRPLKNAQWR